MKTTPRLNRPLAVLLGVALAAGFTHAQSIPQPAAPGGTFDPSRPITAEPDTTAYSRVAADPRLSTFLDLLKATQQESLLRSETLTVFAPTNEAFAALGTAEIERLKKPENAGELKKLVRGHVLLQIVPANKLTTSGRLRSFGGRRLLPVMTAGRVTVEGAKIVQTDITASNGVVHIIDAVLRWPTGTVLQAIEKDPSLSRFTEMLKLSGKDTVLNGTQNYTVLAPSNAAIERISPAAIHDLMDPEKRTDLDKFVSRHIFAGMIFSESLGTIASSQRGIPSMAGDPLHSEVKDGKPLFNKTARLVKTDLETSNGVVHEIDDVLRFIPWGDEAPKVPDQPVPAEAPKQPSTK
jgi:uncharacterized surface protein with fasciclin (FAS1) repeats